MENSNIMKLLNSSLHQVFNFIYKVFYNFLMAQTDILGLLFNQFLRINPMTISKYTTPQDQLLNLFLIPHIILFLFIYGFAWVIIPQHRGLRYLASIGAYLSMVMMGSPYSYYGTLVPFFLIWWQIALFVALFFFIGSRIIHPSKIPELYHLGKAATEKVTEKGKKNAAIEKKIESIDAQIQALERRRTMVVGNVVQDNPIIAAEIGELERRRAELEKELG